MNAIATYQKYYQDAGNNVVKGTRIAGILYNETQKAIDNLENIPRENTNEMPSILTAAELTEIMEAVNNAKGERPSIDAETTNTPSIYKQDDEIEK